MNWKKGSRTICIELDYYAGAQIIGEDALDTTMIYVQGTKQEPQRACVRSAGEGARCMTATPRRRIRRGEPWRTRTSP